MKVGAVHVDVHGLAKPLLRGRLHAVALLAAVPGVLLLLFLPHSAHARVAAAIYGATLITLFAASSSYHRLGRTPRWQRILRRADHASIFLLIAGSYTPIALVAIGGLAGWVLAVTAWTVAGLGVLMKLVWFDRTNKLGGFLYIALGWMVVAAAPVVISHLSLPQLILLAVGGLVYTGGSIVLATRRPDPNPRVFGYHEVWHTAVIVAAACHYAAILLVVRGA